MVLSAWKFRKFARSAHTSVSKNVVVPAYDFAHFAANNAPAKCLLPVNFGLRATANSQTDRKENSRAIEECVNLGVCRHAYRREQGAVHVGDLGLACFPAMLNLRMEYRLTPGILIAGHSDA